MKRPAAALLATVLVVACTGTRTTPYFAPPDSGAALSDGAGLSDVAVPSRDDIATPDVPTGDASSEDAVDTAQPPIPNTCLGSGPSGVADVWYRDAVFYEVFVRSFQDSDGDGIGDLAGLTQRLDYLNDGDPATDTDLGVTALWLMPINPSPSYHGYDVTDYRGIEPDYGTFEDFDLLVGEAKKRGIGIVLDLVVNHSSKQHPWFVSARTGAASVHSPYYVWSDEKLDWGKPWDPKGSVWHAAGGRWYYGVFSSHMPDLNLLHPALRLEVKDIASFWAERGVNGFRLDAARYLVENGEGAGQADQPETHSFWKELRAHVQSTHPEVLLVGEVWTAFEDTVPYFGEGDELQMVFGFDRAEGLRTSLRLGTRGAISGPLCSEVRDVPEHGLMGSFASNHDLDRLATDVKDAEGLKLGATMLLTLPGVPFVYYGEELGLPNGPASGDEAKRLPMRWDTSKHFGFTTAPKPWQSDLPGDVAPVSEQANDAGSLWSHYRRLIALRRADPALTAGGTARLPVEAVGGSVLAVLRFSGVHRTLVVANFGKAGAGAVAVDLSQPALGLPEALTTEVSLGRSSLGGLEVHSSTPLLLGDLGPRESIILRLSATR